MYEATSRLSLVAILEITCRKQKNTLSKMNARIALSLGRLNSIPAYVLRYQIVSLPKYVKHCATQSWFECEQYLEDFGSE